MINLRRLAASNLLRVFCFCFYIFFVSSVHDSLNFLLKAGTRQCFFEDFNKGTPARTLEVFVQAGGTNDVLLTIHGPLELDEIRNDSFDSALVEEHVDAAKEVESETLTLTMDFKPKEAGTYAFCLDNRKAQFLSKIVQLDVRLAPRPEPIALKIGGEASKGDEEEGIIRAKESISRIRKGLTKIQIQQQRDRHRLALHSETNINSHNRVVSGSIVETACFVAVSIFQVFSSQLSLT